MILQWRILEMLQDTGHRILMRAEAVQEMALNRWTMLVVAHRGRTIFVFVQETAQSITMVP